jgi:hypothetical protein
MPKPQKSAETIPAEVAELIADDDYILPEDAALLQGNPVSLGNLADTQARTIEYSTGYSQVTGPMIELNDFNIIDKALSKKQLPDIQVGIDWNNFPEREINMLLDIMEIKIEDIVRWYTNQVDVDHVAACLRSAIETYILNRMTTIDHGQTPVCSGIKVEEPTLVNDVEKKPKHTPKDKKPVAAKPKVKGKK